MGPIDELLDWAAAEGIVLDGITAKALPGRGIGIVATRALKPGEEVLTVPTSALRSIGNTPRPIARRLKGATVQATLAVSLCKDTTREFAPWRAVLPSKRDVEASMPLCWPEHLQGQLPPPARALLAKQQAVFKKDWAAVAPAWPDIPRDDFAYAWLLVNSRTFYHTTARTRRLLPKTDHMVLQPVADLFNHASDDACCRVAYDEHSYSVTTSSAHDAGEELFIRYGTHTNDFLLVEYGFTLPLTLNHWDDASLDPYLRPLLNYPRIEMLAQAGFLGDYKLDAATTCYRTQTALRALCLPEGQWRAVLEGRRDEDADREAVDKQLLAVLKVGDRDIGRTLDRLEYDSRGAGVDDNLIRDSLRQRWRQVRELVVAAISRLEE